MSKHAYYAAGERQCEICGHDMPAMKCWVGRTRFYCDTPECRSEFHKRKYNTLVIGENEKACERPGCSGFAPVGNYDPRTKYFFCSDLCEKQFKQSGSFWTICDWCGKAIWRKRRSGVHPNFCSSKHTHQFRSDKVISKRVGQFMPILDEYLEWGKSHYRTTYSVRNAMSYFFQFLNEIGIEDLESVIPKVISRFMNWERKRGKTNPGGYLGFVKVFFDWLIAEGRRKGINPVVPRIHSVKKPVRLPRPYSEEELDYIWKLLEQRGNARLRLAFAIGLETGLRISEVCNLRVQEVDMLKQTVFVRTPNKTMREGKSHFHDLTRQCLRLWLEERYANGGHDYLLHNTLGRPCSTSTLTLEFLRVLCKVARNGQNKKVQMHEEGLDRFNFHRLRHSMASRMGEAGADLAAVMAQGRWVSPSSASGYVSISEEKRCRSYNDTMKRVHERPPQARIRTSAFRISPKPVELGSDPMSSQ